MALTQAEQCPLIYSRRQSNQPAPSTTGQQGLSLEHSSSHHPHSVISLNTPKVRFICKGLLPSYVLVINPRLTMYCPTYLGKRDYGQIWGCQGDGQ